MSLNAFDEFQFIALIINIQITSFGQWESLYFDF